MTVSRPCKISALESLPTELLQDILLRTYSIDFALCSTIIGARLSNEYCYHWICFRYFYEVHAENGWMPRNRRGQYTIEETRRLQGRLMTMKWMTPTFFKQFLSNIKAISTTHWTTVQGSLETCFIPVRLLRSPLTRDRIEFLQFLLDSTSLRLDWSCLATRQAITTAKRDAVLKHNKDAVILFIQNRQLGKPPDMDLIRFAVLTAGCDRTIVFMLMQAARRWGLRMWQDDMLDAWVKQAKTDCNPKGRWLEQKLLELRQPGGVPDPSTGSYTLPGDELDLPDNRIVLKSRTNRFAYSQAAM